MVKWTGCSDIHCASGGLIVNLQSPDKAGFTLRYNRLVRVRFVNYLMLLTGRQFYNIILL